MSHSAEPMPAKKSNSFANWKIQLGVLCGMLLLALIGMGITQASEKNAWEYWLLVVVVYAGLSLWRTFNKAKQDGTPFTNLAGREIAHWLVLLAFFALVMLLERREIISRESASDFSLALLALACCLAGVHFDWMLMIVGVVLTVMLMAMATLEQYSIVLWILMILVVIGGAAFFWFKSRSGSTEVEDFDKPV